ncbi:hypothetical protein JXA12_02540 [Candidatus Woesearchaeota archaeon]|nr:hypothetical protein [Candidatus Woesearchaeota archaeon]
MRRAQIEIMGLVVVVILVTIGLFFALSLKRTTPTQKPVVDRFGQDTMAKDFLTVLLETQPQGCSPSVSGLQAWDLAKDCVRYRNSGVSIYACDGANSCEALKSIAKTIAEATLDEYGMTYNLSYVYEPPGEEGPQLIFNISTGCHPYSDAQFTSAQPYSSLGRTPIPLYRVTTGKAYLELRICD